MEDLSHIETDIRPWGKFERYTHNESSTVKIIIQLPPAPGGLLRERRPSSA